MKIELSDNYKTLVEKYYKGFEFVVGENAPKLTKQLEKQGIAYTNEESQAFGDLKKYLFGEGLNENLDFIFTDDLPDYDEQDEWAFDGSCHHGGGEGQYTSEILATLSEARYCYIWADGEPIGRFYYLDNGQDLAVADLYCDGGHGIYTVPRLLLAIAYGRKYADFVEVDTPLVVSPHGNCFGYWSNLTAGGYAHFSTNPDWEPIHIFDEDFKTILTENGEEWSENCQAFINELNEDYVYCENIKDYEYIGYTQVCDNCYTTFSENSDYVQATQEVYCCEECAIEANCIKWEFEWYSPCDYNICENCEDIHFLDWEFCSDECSDEYHESHGHVA